MPDWKKKFTKKTHHKLDKLGMTKAQARGKIHGLRHAYAQERYEKITGFKPRVKFENFKDFEKQARAVSTEWKKIERYARSVLKMELGHGPDRDSTISQYIGSSCK